MKSKEIKLLPAHLRNQIAAGEVVERPASVVKELVENSLDAGASEIVVEIENGGIKLIRVRDDGFGISQNQLEMAVKRHATSKIAELEDLQKITSNGFRGEALSSIAAVSKFKLISRPENQETAGCVEMIDGEMKTAPCAFNFGTEVLATEIFFNTPARRKYLKTEQTEYQQILQTVTQLALANCSVAFRLTHNTKTIFELPKNQALRERIRALLGTNFAESLVSIFYESHDLQIHGFIGKPEVAKAARRHQYFFVNSRPITDSSLSFFVREGFGSLLMQGRNPAFVIFIEINPELVDCNSHPRKTEVKFLDKQHICLTLKKACKAALEKENLSPVVFSQTQNFAANRIVTSPNANQIQNAMEFNKNFSVAQNNFELSKNSVTNSVSGDSFSPRVEIEFTDRPHSTAKNSTMNFVNENAATAEIRDLLPPMHALCQIENSYIVAQSADGLLIIDQHAAHERVLFAEFSKRKASQEKSIQKMALPLQLELSQSEAAFLQDNLDFFNQIGFEISEFGGNSFAVYAVPVGLEKADCEEVILGIISDLSQEKGLKNLEERQKRILDRLACRAAVKFGDSMSLPQMQSLLDQMRKTEGIFTCPHGRPTMLNFSFYELERRFGRKT
jgi:DNA mismatch repair protein MutL